MRIELRQLSKHYGSHIALQSVDLQLPARQTTALIGPSGCGKSTLLRCLIGLVRPDQGELLFDDKPLAAQSLGALRRQMGYVIQDGGLFPHLRAGENVCLAARQQRLPADRINARLAELAELVRLDPALMARYPAQLSGGQRQRVSLMRALMLDPQLLLMDEPLAALDPMIRAELQTDLRHIFEQLGKTVVWVTHDLAEAAWFSRHILLMQAGRVLQAGSLEQLRARPANDFVRRFLAAQQQLHAGAGT